MKIDWKYALGEICIVIVGISLAFWLNNWGASISNKKAKNQYLVNLLLDLEEESKHLTSNQQGIQRRIGQIRQLMPHLGHEKPGKDTMMKVLFEVANMVSFRPENTTYETLVNSGDLKLIDNFELRRSIEGHYNFHGKLEDDYSRIEHIHTKYLADFFVEEMDYAAIRRGNVDVLDKPLLVNIMSSIQGAYYLVLNTNKICLEKNEALTQLIKADLGQ